MATVAATLSAQRDAFDRLPQGEGQLFQVHFREPLQELVELGHDLDRLGRRRPAAVGLFELFFQPGLFVPPLSPT